MPAGVPLRSARISLCRARCVSRRMDSLTAFRFPGLRCSLPLICGQVRIAIFPEKLTADGEQPSGDGVARMLGPRTGSDASRSGRWQRRVVPLTGMRCASGSAGARKSGSRAVWKRPGVEVLG